MTIAALPFDPDRAGVDEAGRGPLAGPVVVAAVLLPAGFDASGIRDSKKMTPDSRTAAYDRIVSSARHEICIVPVETIDRMNILRATLWGMGQALSSLRCSKAVVDGRDVPFVSDCGCEALIKGDDKDACVAAASVLAKVTRDRLMLAAAQDYPGYGWEGNKGYGDARHIEALKSLGPTPLHRRSFEPLKSMLTQPVLEFF